MGVIKALFKTAVYGAATTVATFAVLTRKSEFPPVTAAAEELFKSELYKRLNPDGNTPLYDVCVRRVRLDKIRPELRNEPEALVTAFCAGIWSGNGYEIQRRILERKYRDETTAGQLWTRGELAEADYAVGTVVTDHFEVVDRAPERILLRCGGSPKVSDVRESDGLFEIGARVKEEEGVAEFYLKSVLFQGLGKAEAGSKGPMPEWMVALHKVYAKIWMETAIWACMK